MKKLFGLLSLLALVFLASCGDDDTANTVTDVNNPDDTVIEGSADVVIDADGNVTGEVMDKDGEKVADIDTTVEDVQDAMEK